MPALRAMLAPYHQAKGKRMSSEQEQPRTRAELIDRMERSRQALERSFSQLTDEQIDAPSSSDHWSIKNHLAHIAAWEAGSAALLRKQPRWIAMGIEQQLLWGDDEDAINEAIYQRWKNQPLAEVRAVFDAAHNGMIAALNDLSSDDDLLRSYSYFQPEHPGDDDGSPIVENVAGNSYEHYDEHQQWIDELVQQRGWT